MKSKNKICPERVNIRDCCCYGCCYSFAIYSHDFIPTQLLQKYNNNICETRCGAVFFQVRLTTSYIFFMIILLEKKRYNIAKYQQNNNNEFETNERNNKELLRCYQDPSTATTTSIH